MIGKSTDKLKKQRKSDLAKRYAKKASKSGFTVSNLIAKAVGNMKKKRKQEELSKKKGYLRDSSGKRVRTGYGGYVRTRK